MGFPSHVWLPEDDRSTTLRVLLSGGWVSGKKTMSEKTRYWCIECGWHPRWNPENPLKSHSNEMNCEVMLWYPVFTWLCLNIGYLQNSLLTVIIIFRDHHPKKSDTALCYHSSQICYISPHEHPWTGWLLQCAPPSSYKLVYMPQ